MGQTEKDSNKIALKLSNLSRTFHVDGEPLEVLENIDLEIQQGEFVSIVGASGCGKSTMLKLIVGLDHPTDGEIQVDGRVVKKPSTDCGMIFQEARLYPWLTVERNISFGASKTLSKEEKKQKVAELVELVGLKGFEKAYPEQLSGGMQQRVGIARALIGDPKVLLLDEPFGALDAFTRINMQNETLHIWEQSKKTMILVTHDIDEAIFLSDRVIVLSAKPGKIQDIIDIKMPRPRDRSNEKFMMVRRTILKSLLGKQDIDIEYYI